MTKIVNSWNDWDPLKRVIVGRCDNSMIPPEEPATSEKVPVDSEMRGMWGLRPLRTVERGNECLENLVKAVEERGVIVDRPTPLQWNQKIGTPDFTNDSMMTCMPRATSCLPSATRSWLPPTPSAAVTSSTWPIGRS